MRGWLSKHWYFAISMAIMLLLVALSIVAYRMGLTPEPSDPTP